MKSIREFFKFKPRVVLPPKKYNVGIAKFTITVGDIKYIMELKGRARENYYKDEVRIFSARHCFERYIKNCGNTIKINDNLFVPFCNVSNIEVSYEDFYLAIDDKDNF